MEIEPLATMTCMYGHRCSFEKVPKSAKCKQCTLYRLGHDEGLELALVSSDKSDVSKRLPGNTGMINCGLLST